jgi:hypothetical protein
MQWSIFVILAFILTKHSLLNELGLSSDPMEERSSLAALDQARQARR